MRHIFANEMWKGIVVEMKKRRNLGEKKLLSPRLFIN